MKCPKCAHEQTDAIECEKCGIFFAKVIKVDDPVTATDSPAPNYNQLDRKHPPFLLPGILILAIIFGAGGYWLGATNKNGDIPDNTKLPHKTGNSNLSNDKNENQTSAKLRPKGINANITNDRSTTDPRFSRRLEHARNATVFVRSHWGSGSGFFIDGQENIITNRHVVEPRKDEIARLENKMNKLGREIDVEYDNINYLKNELPKIEEKEFHQKIVKQIDLREEKLARARSIHPYTTRNTNHHHAEFDLQ